MSQKVLLVEKERFLLNDSKTYMITGIISEEGTIESFIDGKPLQSTVKEKIVLSPRERTLDEQFPGGKWVDVLLALPADLKKHKVIKIYVVNGEKRRLWYKSNVKEIARQQGKPQFFLDAIIFAPKENAVGLGGWAVGKTPVQIKVFDENKKPLEMKVKRCNRMDVVEMYRECPVEEKCGFSIRVENVTGKKIYFVIRDQEGNKNVYKIGTTSTSKALGKISTYSKKAAVYYRAHGAVPMLKKCMNRLVTPKQKDGLYETWLKENKVTRQELNRQRRTVFKEDIKFSIVVPLYKTDKYLLKSLVDSVLAQTYSNWELCLSDGSGADSPIKDILKEYEKKDSRIRVVYNEKPLQISDNTNAAIGIATGNYITFSDHDDTLAEEALFQMASEIVKHPEAELLYSDEDIIDIKGKRLFPHFKPDFNPDYLHCVNYICHLVVVKRELLDKVGLLRGEFDGSQDYDFLLRCTEHTKNIRHIPKLLYHWRSHEGSTAGNPDDKPYAVIAGEKALAEHYERMGIDAEVEYTGNPVVFRTHFAIKGNPKVSILIPNKDHTDDLEKCVSSIMEKSTWKNVEIIVIENNSEDEKTFRYYEELEKRYPQVKVVRWEGVFNYSAINNFGAKYATGEFLLLLNNDTEVITPEWLESLMGYCQREDVAIVGAKLLYPDNTVQHAGVVVGIAGFAGHILTGYDKNAMGYLWRLGVAQDESAVTGACLMVRRDIFDQLHGLDESFTVALNDIDFCLRARELGKLVVFTPEACLYHYESKSRGMENTDEKQLRFKKEIHHFRERHAQFLKDGDPYYNPNLSLVRGDCTFRMQSERKVEENFGK